jgi:nicotinamidase-related amidase
MATLSMRAEPYEFEFDAKTTALVVIDMQRDFVEPGGFGEALGNDVTPLQAVIEPCRQMLDAARGIGMLVIHTREGHSPDLADCPPTKIVRGRGAIRIGDPGPMGRLLVRGERGHQIVPQLAPQPGEVVVDKPGKGAFCATDLDLILHNRGIRSLIVCGVTTEVCVHTTIRKANDRGYRCVALSDACASYFPAFHRVAIEMIMRPRSCSASCRIWPRGRRCRSTGLLGPRMCRLHRI